jgi:hypothetical protein
VEEPERSLVPQRNEPVYWRVLLPFQARWVAEPVLQAEAEQAPQQPLAGALLSPVLRVLSS